MNLKGWFGNVWSGVKRNAPTILTAGSVSMFLLSTIEAIKATPKAMEAIEQKKEEEGHMDLTAVQVVQATWKCYIKALLAFGCGTGLAFSALHENNKRIASLLATAEAGRNLLQEFQDYRKFVAEKIGKNKEAEIHNQAVQQVVDRTPLPASMADSQLIEGQAPKPICFDSFSGRYLYADYETILAAVNKLNNEINTGLNGYVSLNDFYDEIHVSTTEAGERLGWSIETGLIAIPEKQHLQYAGTPNGVPCWVLEFDNPPQYEYQFFRRH